MVKQGSSYGLNWKSKMKLTKELFMEQYIESEEGEE